MTSVHRKQKRTFNEPGQAHFLTFSCSHRWALLSKDRSRQWFVDALHAARERFDFDVWAYVVMPEHAHVLIWPRRKGYRVETILAAIKRPVAVSAKSYLIASNGMRWISRLTVTKGTRRVFQFWQPGGGFDKNLTHDRAIEEVLLYIEDNPRRRGLVQHATDWYWSSARWHAGQKDGPLEIDPVRI